MNVACSGELVVRVATGANSSKMAKSKRVNVLLLVRSDDK